MKRREFLKSVGASGYAAVQLGRTQPASHAESEAKERPNFLIMMSDQHNPHVLGCYGDPIVKTPNLDALASRGVTFRHNYCASPLCVPSRTAFLTAQEPAKTRVWMNEDTLCSNIPTFAHSLGAAGYDTALIGRMHFNGMDQWHGFGKRLVGSLLPQYPYLKPPLSPDLWPGAEGRSRKGIDLAGPGKTAYQAYDEDVTEAAIQFLREQAKVTNKPFCAVVGFVRPHPPFVCSKTQWDYYHDRVSIPEVPSTYFQHLHPAIQRWRKMRGIEDITPEEFRRARAAYYGLVTELDIRIGRILGELEKQGLARNTVIVYTSDHGEMAGENGMWWKQNFYEGSVTVPLIMSFADRWVPAQRREVTSLIDVAPTILDMAQAMPLPEAIGSSLLPLLENGNVGWVNEAFSECRPELSVPAIRMIRSGRWKLVHFDGERPQLFDLQNDPHEFNDLAEDVGYAEVRKTLLDRVLSGWSAEDGRIGFERRMASSEMMSKWAVQVRPPLTAQWVAPPGANRFPEAP